MAGADGGAANPDAGEANLDFYEVNPDLVLKLAVVNPEPG